MTSLDELLQKGIELKRAGCYDEALKCYYDARRIDPEDYRSYGNAARLLVGMQQYDLALRNFLVLCVSNNIRKLLSQDPQAEVGIAMALPRFSSNIITLDHCIIQPERIIAQTRAHPYLLDLMYRPDNLAFYIGHAVIGRKQELIGQYSIPAQSMRNLEASLLGVPAGSDLRSTALEYVFLLTGFVFVDVNFKPCFNSVAEAAAFYMSEKTTLQYNFSEYNAASSAEVGVFGEIERARTHNTEETVASSLFRRLISRFKQRSTDVAEPIGEKAKLCESVNAVPQNTYDSAFTVAQLYEQAKKYESGEGSPQDVTKAADLYAEAAERGHADSMFKLGVIFQTGEGRQKDGTLAAKWFQKAGDAGCIFAWVKLGRLYEEGWGVQRNLDTAIMWYKRAAAAGDERAKMKLWSLSLP